MKTGIELIAEEREEQIKKHGYDTGQDAEFYENGELIEAAQYAITLERKYYPQSWELDWHDRMMAKKNRLSKHQFWVERLKIAGALIAAELDRVQDLYLEDEN